MYVVLGTASLLTLAGRLEGSLTPDAVLAQVLHLSNYYIIQHGWWDGRAPGTWIYWSLAVEEHFYLVFPLVYLALRRSLPSRRAQALVLVGLCALVLAWRVLLVFGLGAPKDRTYVATDTRVDSILFGCALAVYGNPVLDGPLLGGRLQGLWLPLGVAGLLVSFLVRAPEFEQSVRYSLQGVALVPLFIAAIRHPEWVCFRILNLRPVAFIGTLSYSVYLLHPTVLFALEQRVGWPALPRGALALGIALALALAIYHLIEKPCARLRRRLSPTRRAALAPPTGAHRPAPALFPERMTQPMHVSAVICTRNRPDLIGPAVKSVLANTYPSFDLLVVDQSDDERSGEVVRKFMRGHPRLSYLHSPTPGLSRAYNTAIRETRGVILAFTDDDCIAPPDWIASIARAFETDPRIDLLYGQVLVPAVLADEAGNVPTLRIGKAENLSRRDTFRIYGMGANYAARRGLFERLGGFDEALGGGGPLKSSQDFDLQYRAYVAGAVTGLRPEVRVEHYGLRTPDQWPATQRAYGVGDGAFYFKHVRCGDLFALRLLLARLGRLAVREALIALRLRRRPSQLVYLLSCLAGIRHSLRYPVDRGRRLYRPLGQAS
jgi:peptidoglycan/LPS O-acetylase OafA/YrhL/glycosyltransferase involved in cell wall biosynthesis